MATANAAAKLGLVAATKAYGACLAAKSSEGCTALKEARDAAQQELDALGSTAAKGSGEVGAGADSDSDSDGLGAGAVVGIVRVSLHIIGRAPRPGLVASGQPAAGCIRFASWQARESPARRGRRALTGHPVACAVHVRGAGPRGGGSRGCADCAGTLPAQEWPDRTAARHSPRRGQPDVRPAHGARRRARLHQTIRKRPALNRRWSVASLSTGALDLQGSIQGRPLCASPHVRRTRMGCACGEAHRIKRSLPK